MTGPIPSQWASGQDWQRLVAKGVNPVLGEMTYSLAALPFAGNANKLVRVNAGATALEMATAGTSNIADDAVTYAKMQNAAGAGVLGATAAGDHALLTIGPGLKLVGSILVPTVIGCRAIMAADQAAANYTTNAAIPFDGTDDFDTNAFHDPATNNTRITIADLTATYGVRAKKVTLTATVSVASLTADLWVYVNIFKSGALFNPGARQTVEVGNTNPGVSITVEDVIVVGDGTEYFEVFLQVETDTSITVSANRTSFSMKVTDWG